MKESLSNIEKKTIGGWDAPCETIDYEKLAENAQKLCDSLRIRLSELNHSPLEPGETALARRRTVRILTDMYYEQKSYWKLFQKRSSPQGERTEESKTAGKAAASPAISARSKKRMSYAKRVSPPSSTPPLMSAEMAERLLASLTSRMPSRQKKPPVPHCPRQQDGRQERR